MSSKWFYKIAGVVTALLLQFPLNAQCSMCKAVAESADGGGFGMGLNYGILYLMAFPYLIVGFIAYRIYKSKKASQ